MNTRKKQKMNHQVSPLGPSPQSIVEVNSIFNDNSDFLLNDDSYSFHDLELLDESIDRTIDLVSATPQSTDTHLMDTTQTPQSALSTFKAFFQYESTCIMEPDYTLPEQPSSHEKINKTECYESTVIEHLQKAIKRNDLVTIEKLIVYVDFNEPYFIQNGYPEKMNLVQFAFCHCPLHFLRYFLHEYKDEIQQKMLNETLDYLYLHSTCFNRQTALAHLLIEHGAQPSVEPRTISLY